MSPARGVVIAPVCEIPSSGLDEWTRAIGQRLESGSRVVTLFGRLETRAVVTTAVLEEPGGPLTILRGRGPLGASFPSLTLQHPAVQMFERELWEQTGLTPSGHPWLKPVRYEGDRQQRMREHPFFSVRGQDIHEVGVGPIHAGVIEPGHFRFMCYGERVRHLEVQLGYQHRGVETALLRRPPFALAPLVESIVGDSSIAYAWGYCAAAEALSGTSVAVGAGVVAGVALELERIAMHLATLAGLAADIAFLQGSASYGRLRTAIINATMRVCGSRFGRGWLRPGGVRYGLDDDLRRDLLTTLAAVAEDVAAVNDMVVSARSVRARLQGVGVVSRQAALDLGLVGVAARSSGVALDARSSQPGPVYAAHPIALLTEADGDCWARMKLRMREVAESIRWLTTMLDAPTPGMDTIGGAVAARMGGLLPNAVCVSVREGCRGPVVHVLETGEDGRLIHYKVQDPSLLNWFGLACAVRNADISDFPICNKSFDLSYCGNDL